jgi:hypothetical protein
MKIEVKLTEAQVEKLNKWFEEQNLKIIAKQKETIKPDDPFYDLYKMGWDDEYPYGGAIGGSITYHITHTSIGTIIKVSDSQSNEEIDLTEYEHW